ncbi:MAG: chemotaxis protein [Proteobacteria bacterium]|nr:chemotaxis protein [Pseudomonadota bacterium]
MARKQDKQAAQSLPVLIGGGLVLLALAAALLVFSGRLQQQERDYQRHVAELTRITAAMPALAPAASGGDETALARLGELRDSLATLLDEVDAGRASFETLSSPSARRLGDDPAWRALLDGADAVLAGRATAAELRTWAGEARTALGRVLAATGNAVSAPGGAAAIRSLPQFEAAAQRAGDDLQALASTPGSMSEAAARIAENSMQLGRFLAGLAGEDDGAGVPRLTGEAASRLAEARSAFGAYDERLRGAMERAEKMAGIQRTGDELAAAAGSAYDKLSRPAHAGEASVLAGPYPALAAVALAMALLAAALFAWLSAAGLRRQTEQQARQSQRNQEAILRLLDEMSSLADGDLTVQATVTDDITGAIADAINYAIEALRELVLTINDTAVQLDSAARQTQAAAGHLAKASVAQSRQVAAATDAVGAMASSIEEVSSNSERCSDVARHAVDVSHKGADAVRRTIDGMNAIRENIQVTSKRIKRLGESSQEIGNIVELINDIAEQTNILALNASIQASMAGEAGRGFAVVADEVQRLAERAGHATRQIEVLVRTIQSDTNEAVVSMERTTTDVVGGALLAENAGAALGEIESVSNQIAQLVQNISGSARQQAATSAHISRTMQVLREISQQTADNTSATSSAIGRLADLSALLRKSVTGFRLPQETPKPAAPTGKRAVARPAAAPAPVPEPEPPARRAGAGG